MDNLQIIIAIISLISALVGLAAALAGRRQIIEVRPAVAGIPGAAPEMPEASHAGQPRAPTASVAVGAWHDKPIWLVFWLLFFWPVGVYGLLRSRLLSARLKRNLAWGFGLLMLLLLAGV